MADREADGSDQEPQATATPAAAPPARRGFLVALGGASAAWVVGGTVPVYRFLSPLPPPDPFGKEGRAKVEKVTPADVARPGSGQNGSYAGRGLVILRDAKGELRAFDAKCSHAGCNVVFQGAQIFCHCHGGTYDLDGKNIAGPPPRPLTPLTVVEENGVFYVTRPASRRA